MEEQFRLQISQEFLSCVNDTISRLQQEPTHRPFHTALLSEEVIFHSRFERSFSTSFGQKAIENISEIAAIVGGATQTKRQKETIVNLPVSAIKAIDDHLLTLRDGHSGHSPNWPRDLQNIRSQITTHDSMQSIRVISDLWWLKDGISNYVSIKTVKPNIDQTETAKKDLLRLKLNDPSCNVYFGLYYNPFGNERSDYSWSPPQRILNFLTDEVVLIGKDYWETLGGLGFYDELLAIAREVGETTRISVGNTTNPHSR